MDLDTNAKKFKYSTLFKIICVILCFVTFCSSAWIACFVGTGVAYNIGCVYNDEDSKNDWTNSTEAYRVLWNDGNNLVTSVTRENEVTELITLYKKNKKQYVDEAYKIVQKLRLKAEKDAEDYYDSYYDEDEDYSDIETTTVYYKDYTNNFDITIDDRIIDTVYLEADMTKKDIEKILDDAVPAGVEALWEETPYYSISSDAIYSIKYDKKEVSSEELEEKDFYSMPYYLISKHGKVESKGINETVVSDVIGSLKGNHKEFKNVDFYLAFNPKKMSLADSFTSMIDNHNYYYSELYSFSLATREMTDSLVKNVVLAIVLLALSFFFGFMYFSISGKKNENEPAKLIFYDYIPFGLDLAIVGGLGTGAGVLCAIFADRFVISTLTIYAMFLFAIACWILLFFTCASLSRYIHSDKKFYKHLLSYWIALGIGTIFKYIFVAFKWCVSKVKRFFAKIKHSCSRTANALLYKPLHFKRNVVLISIAWLLLNVVLLSIFIASLFGEAFLYGVIPMLLDAAMNFFAIRKVAEYIGNLDKIIDASSRHEEVMLDLEYVDASLKTLADGMRYTNAELQKAISKAVKDERLRAELITNVSHDLKTPLTSIITYVDLLSKCDINDAKAKEYIKVLDEKGSKLKRLIDDLIEASKVTSGNVTVNLAPMNLSELCLQATVDAQDDFEKAGLELVVKQGEKPAIVIADGTKANRIIENLLSNARKYSAKASRVYVSVYDEPDCGVFEIKNISAQALDISPEELTERFVRGDKSRNQEGNGLGLSIAKELCSIQNGKLELIIDGDLFKARVILPK